MALILSKTAGRSLKSNSQAILSHPNLGKGVTCMQYASYAPAAEKKHVFDVVVVGSGCSGLTAALVAAKHGLRTLVVEKSQYYGGTTAFSGGGAWIPNNKHQASVGITDDNYEKATTYLRQVVGDLYSSTHMDSFLKYSPDMVKWVEENSSVRFKPVLLPDYHVEKPGASVARTLLTKEFDGRVLGRRRLSEVRYTLQGFHAFGSMQADPAELAVLTNPFGGISNFYTSTRKIIRYIIDVIMYGKGAEMANGNALVGRLIKSCDDADVELWKNSAAVRTLRNQDGRVTGIVASNSGGDEVHVKANCGVILASGGFGRSSEARKYLPHEWSAVPKHNVGDGKRIAVESGAIMSPPNPDNGIFAPLSLLRTPDDQVRRYPHFAIDRSKPGSVIVCQDGRRFANESEPYQEFVKTMHRRKIDKAYFIADSTFLKKYGMGMALPWPMPVRPLIKQGYLIEAASIQELAARIGIPGGTLSDTVEKCNENARNGEDPEFHRGENSYDQFYGDASTKLPNPNLGLCVKAPFYALPIYPGNVSSTYGLAVNQFSQTLNAEGNPVAGLYAVGLDANSVMRGTYPGGGSSIGPGMTFGYLAGLHLAGKV